jgi:hypothetical protein
MELSTAIEPARCPAASMRRTWGLRHQVAEVGSALCRQVGSGSLFVGIDELFLRLVQVDGE